MNNDLMKKRLDLTMRKISKGMSEKAFLENLFVRIFKSPSVQMSKGWKPPQFRKIFKR